MNVYHYSRRVFNFPDIQEIERNLSGHFNGLLGLWVTLKEENWAKGFGELLYTMTVPAANPRHLSVGALSKMGPEPEPYQRLRCEMLEDGVDFLYIVERDGTPHMGVVTDFDAITDFRLARGVLE